MRRGSSEKDRAKRSGMSRGGKSGQRILDIYENHLSIWNVEYISASRNCLKGLSRADVENHPIDDCSSIAVLGTVPASFDSNTPDPACDEHDSYLMSVGSGNH